MTSDSQPIIPFSWLKTPQLMTDIQQSRRRWEYAFVLLLAVLAVLITLLARRTQVLLSSDAFIWYGPAVQALLNGEGYQAFAGDTFRGPFFPFAVYVVANLLGGRIFEAGLIVGVVAYLFFVTGVFLATRKAFDARLAFLLSVAVGLNATVLFNSVEWLTDMSFAALSIFSLYWMFFQSKKYFWLGPILAGAAGGLALTTRWNGAFLLFAVVLHPLVNPLHLTWRRRLLWLAAYLLGFVAAASPWFWINWQLNGSPLYNTSYITGFHDALVSPNIPPGASLVGTILGDPVFFTANFLRRFLWDGWSDVGPLIPRLLLLFAPAGLLVWLFSMNRSRLWYATYFTVFWAIASLTHFEPRFYLVLLPAVLLCPLLFFLSDVFPDRTIWTDGPSIRLTAVLLLLIGIGVFNYRSVVNKVDTIVADRLPQVQVAEWLERAQANESVTTTATRFFSGARHFIDARAGLSATTLASAAEYLQPPATISHVFVEESLPDLTGGEIDPAMFDLSQPNPQLEAVFFKPDEPRAVLYRVLLDNAVITPTVASASSIADSTQDAPFAVDGDITTAWMSAPQDASAANTSITLDFGSLQEINRLWILPANATAFPRAFNLLSSVDGQTWEMLAAFEDYPSIERQDPQVFPLDTVKARYLRINSVDLRPDAEGNYQMGFSEIHVSLATERNNTPYSFVDSDFAFDPQTGQVATCIVNNGTVPGAAQVTLTIDGQTPILMQSASASPQATVCFHTPLALLVAPGTHMLQIDLLGPKNAEGLSQQKRQVDIPFINTLAAWQNDNLLPEPGLEAEGEGWLIQAPVHFDQDIVHDGARALRVDKVDFDAPSFYHVATPTVVLSPHTQYIFGGWIKTQDVQVNPALVSTVGDKLTWALPRPGATDFNTYNYGTGTQEWAMWSGMIGAGAEPQQTALSLMITDFRSGSVWLDDVFVLPLYTVTIQ